MVNNGYGQFAEIDPNTMVGKLIASVFERMISDNTDLQGKGNESPDAGPVSNTQTDMDVVKVSNNSFCKDCEGDPLSEVSVTASKKTSELDKGLQNRQYLNVFEGFWSSLWKKISGIFEKTASSVTLAVTGVAMPMINQASVIWNEGCHPGPAWNEQSKVSWAVPYTLQNWKFVRQDQMSGQTLSWEDGKKVMKSTTNTLLLITPIKHNIPIQGVSPLLQKGINYGAGWGTKQLFKQGFHYWLDY